MVKITKTLVIPNGYKSKLDLMHTEIAIKERSVRVSPIHTEWKPSLYNRGRNRTV